MEKSFGKYLKGRSLQEFIAVPEGEQELEFNVHEAMHIDPQRDL